MRTKFCVEDLMERNYLQDQGVDGRTILLKYIVD